MSLWGWVSHDDILVCVVTVNSRWRVFSLLFYETNGAHFTALWLVGHTDSSGKMTMFWLGKCSAEGNCWFDSLLILSCCAAKKRMKRRKSKQWPQSSTAHNRVLYLVVQPTQHWGKITEFCECTKWKGIWYKIWSFSFVRLDHWAIVMAVGLMLR